MPSFMSSPSYFVANKESLRRMNLDRTYFRKPTQMYTVLDFFGKNLVTTEGPAWKTHRKIVGPSFSEVRLSPRFYINVASSADSHRWVCSAPTRTSGRQPPPRSTR